MRYRGQAYNLTVPLAARPATAETIAAAVAAFEEEHSRLYDYTPSVTETEIVTLRLQALARIPTIDWAGAADRARPAGEVTRRVWSNGCWRAWRVVARSALQSGSRLEPETIVEQEDATVVVPAGWQARAVAAGTLVLERSQEAV
jgi:N-methylhydantoinase A